ncbi:MAG: preprotein translocase subunit SecE [Clostridia bacterium]|nr:preprotein translocase subunit SecE [Clostridia bacterium]
MENTITEKPKAPVKKASKPNGFLKKIKDWLVSCKNMCKKIIWPKPKTVIRNFFIVLATSIVLVLVIWGLDYVFTTLVTFVLSIFAG